MDLISLRIEKPVAGGRMLARHDGAIVLVSGALPGELVEVEVVRSQRRTLWADTRRVVEASPHRVAVEGDDACGGSVYAHAAYEHQCVLKSQVLSDAFARVGRMPLERPITVRPSPVDGYRMRARLHARDGRLGFFREGTHELCDAVRTRQLRTDTADLVQRLEAALAAVPRAGVTAVELAENRDATERACHLVLAPDGDPSRLAAATRLDGFTGASCSMGEVSRTLELWGEATVTDVLSVLDRDGTHVPARLTRHARAFFQGNRYLLDDLVAHVTALVPDGPVVDLYAGVGLFAVALAAAGRGPVVAVEGDGAAAADLKVNARPLARTLAVHAVPVEASATWTRGLSPGATVLVDPPRTGMSRQALEAVLQLAPPRIVYVSCDVATLARDVRTCADRGYRLGSAEAFDMFPRTAHVETVVVLER